MYFLYYEHLNFKFIFIRLYFWDILIKWTSFSPRVDNMSSITYIINWLTGSEG